MIQFGEDKYKPALKQMWKLCFPSDSDCFIDFYFNRVYKNEETLVFVEENRPVAALQMIPYQLKLETTLSLAGYISGAMTHPDFRERGYMGKLLLAAFDVMKERGYDYSFLIPQEEWLVGFYGKRGFREFVSPSLKDFKEFKELKEFKEHTRFLSMMPNAVLKDEEQWAVLMTDFLMGERGEFIETKEKRGMIKNLNPSAKTVTTLYMGRMLD